MEEDLRETNQYERNYMHSAKHNGTGMSVQGTPPITSYLRQ